MKKWIVSGVLLLVLCLAAVCACAETTTTVMMYMCGTDIKDDCLTDMKEIASASYGSNVNVAVLAGGTKSWGDSRLNNGVANVFTIAGGKWSSVQNWGKMNMGKADTLVKYVKYCVQNYPADRYVLVLWDHGGGSGFGICYDEVFNDDAMTLAEAGTALAELKSSLPGFRLAVLGMDACLMGSYEAAYMAADYADYLVASEELEPWLGWYYTNWLTDLGSNPSMDNLTLAKSIVDSYRYGCERDDPKDYLTLSAIDLSVMDELNGYMGILGQALANASQSSVSAMSRSFQSCYVFGNYDNASSDMIDMTDFLTVCENYDAAAVQSAREALSRAVVYNYANSYVPDAEGLSIFVPMENASELSTVLSGYAAPDGYLSFVRAFGGAVGNGGYTFTASSTPSQMSSSDMSSDSFLNSAYDYSFGDSWNGWEWNAGDWCYEEDDWGTVACGYGGNYGCGYGYGSGFGYNGSSFVIAGLNSSAGGSQSGGFVIAGLGQVQGQTSDGVTVVAASPDSGFVIAGLTQPAASAQPGGFTIAGVSAATAAPQATAQPSSPAGGFVIAGSQVPETSEGGITVPQSIRDSIGFSMNVSGGDLQELAYAECVLLTEEHSGDTVSYTEMGRVQDTWVDWTNGKVYSLFNGTWPSVNGISVVMYDQAKNGLYRRSLVPVLLNDKVTYLVVQFAVDSTEGTILGSSVGWDEKGLPVRGITSLSQGDVIKPIYPVHFGTASAGLPFEQLTTRNTWYDDAAHVIVWDGSQKVTYTAVAADADYAISFRLHDVYGGVVSTEPMQITLR